jgi:hypothetical protein
MPLQKRPDSKWFETNAIFLHRHFAVDGPRHHRPISQMNRERYGHRIIASAANSRHRDLRRKCIPPREGAAEK